MDIFASDSRFIPTYTTKNNFSIFFYHKLFQMIERYFIIEHFIFISFFAIIILILIKYFNVRANFVIRSTGNLLFSKKY